MRELFVFHNIKAIAH